MPEEVKHTHILTPGLVGILRKIIEGVKEKDRNAIHLQRDVDLSHNEYANAQKLRYFALIAQVKEKSGWWLITELGGKFLRNEEPVIYRVTTCQNHIVGKSEEKRMIKDYFPAYDTAWFQTNFYSIRIDHQISLL